MSSERQSDEVNRKLLEVVPSGIVFVTPDGSIVKANAEACRVLGLAIDTLTKKFVDEFATVTLREDGSQMPVEEYPVSRALITGEKQPPKLVGVKKPDGETSWGVYTALPIHEGDALTGVMVTFVDVTAIRRTEERLLASEARFKSILESAPNVIISTDLDGKIEFINHPAPARLATDVIGHYVWEPIKPEDRERVKACIASVRETGRVDSYEIVAPSGRRFDVHVGPILVPEPSVSGAPAGDPPVKIAGFTFVAWDISRQRDLEARLVVSDRMASIGQLAAGVAHEINNPLTYVLANLHALSRTLAKSGDPALATLAERAAHAVEGAERIKSIVRDLSTFSHTQEHKTVLIDVRPMVESSIRMAYGQLRYRAQIVTKLEEVPPVLANDSRLGQVFLNLLVNAAHAIPEGRASEHTVTISTRTDDGGNVLVLVHDTGAGIPADLVDRVFDPFVTTKAQGEGTGLGLYICKNVVASLGGELTFTSKPGDTTFTVKLPAAPRGEGAHPGSQSQPDLPAFVRRSVLVIDDEPVIRQLAKAALARHQVTVAASGREAIELIDRERYDVILCDLVMPELTGIDVYDHVEEHAPALLSRFVFMTGGAFTERARDFIASHALTILDKPFTMSDLERIVLSLGQRKA